jgi:mevalonate kinase
VIEAGIALRLSVPSKSFFLGEYLALTGGRTLLAATLPRFELRVLEGSGAARGVAPTSPAGRFLAAHPEVFANIDIEFIDPHAGAGGWGASAAQFLMCYATLERIREHAAHAGAMRIDIERLLTTFIEVAWDGRGFPPSGADVVAQLQGGVVEFSKANGISRNHVWPFDDLEFYFLATGNKVPTHEHLRGLGSIDVTLFSTRANSACEALRSRDSPRFVEAIRGYADELERQSLVHPGTLALLQRLEALPGVLARKGCGALGADVAMAIVRADSAQSFASAIEREMAPPVGRAQLSQGLTIENRPPSS